jgi:hypothetical protein
MSSLRSALDEYQDDVSEFPAERVEAEFDDLQWSTGAMHAKRLARLAHIDRHHTYARDGFLSTVSWLCATYRVSAAVAADEVGMARALQHMPRTMQALAQGEISISAVRVLVGAREAHPTEFAEAEDTLVEAASALSHRELCYAVRYWAQAVDSDKALGDEQEQVEHRRLSVSATVFGMVRVDGDLDPETGESLLTALRAQVDADVRYSGPGDQRTPSQRRADALGEICRQWLASKDRPEVAGERPHVTLTLGLDHMQGNTPGTTGPCELGATGPVHPETARRLTCDASIARVVLGPRSEPLDVGRRTPVVPAGIRRAVVARDRGCRFPGCERPEPWCDAHHVIHWADGGSTSLTNLVLLCRPHHRLIHGPVGFGVHMDDGTPVFRRPDGSVLEERAPP